jgi:hypothetical protein
MVEADQAVVHVHVLVQGGHHVSTHKCESFQHLCHHYNHLKKHWLSNSLFAGSLQADTTMISFLLCHHQLHQLFCVGH